MRGTIVFQEIRMGNFSVRNVSAEEIETLVKDMEVNGYGRLANFFTDEIIAETRDYVLGELKKHSGEYFSYNGLDAVQGSLLADLGGSPAFRDILAEVYKKGTGSPPPPSGLYQVLRVLTGATGLKRSFQFHYDAYVVTALVPIIIPTGAGEKRGDLIIYPRLRRIRSSAVFNVIEKFLMQNPLARRLVRSALMQRLFKAKVLQMEPGHIYFFWGYQSLHANEPCLAESVRATALFHFADPHENSFLTRTIQRLGKWRERKVRDRVIAGEVRTQ
jgi:hypothetical protein